MGVERPSPGGLVLHSSCRCGSGSSGLTQEMLMPNAMVWPYPLDFATMRKNFK